jgi:hypothetical protein
LGNRQASYSFRANRIEHGLGLRKIQPSIEKGSLGKLARHSQPGPCGYQAPAQLIQHHRPTMALHLDDIFSGIRMRPFHHDHERLIKHRMRA